MNNHVETIKTKLAHIIDEQIARITKKFIIKRRTCYECYENDHLAKCCPTLDSEVSSPPNESSSTPALHMCLVVKG
jgi:hypothetical protein